jgi:hypothetical protein
MANGADGLALRTINHLASLILHKFTGITHRLVVHSYSESQHGTFQNLSLHPAVVGTASCPGHHFSVLLGNESLLVTETKRCLSGEVCVAGIECPMTTGFFSPGEVRGMNVQALPEHEPPPSTRNNNNNTGQDIDTHYQPPPRDPATLRPSAATHPTADHNRGPQYQRWPQRFLIL